jgi:hypothetical protein
MIPDRKLKAAAPGQPPSEMTRLKALWRTMSEEEQTEWSELLESNTSRPDIRRQIQARLQVILPHDVQVNRFRAWLASLEAHQLEAERMAEEAEELARQGLTDERLDQEILRRTKIRALVRGNYSLGMRAISQTLRLGKFQLQRDKLAGRLPKPEPARDTLANRPKANPANSAIAGLLVAEALERIAADPLPPIATTLRVCAPYQSLEREIETKLLI